MLFQKCLIDPILKLQQDLPFGLREKRVGNREKEKSPYYRTRNLGSIELNV